MKTVERTIYRVVAKGNGKFAPRVFIVGNNDKEIEGYSLGNWFKHPYEYDTCEEAKQALIKYKKEQEEKNKLLFEKVVFEL